MKVLCRRRLVRFGLFWALAATAFCALTSATAAANSQVMLAGVTARAPDAFYDPQPNASQKPGTLLRNEPLKDVVLPAGVRGWRIFYATTVDDKTPATAVATVFAATDLPAGPRPLITWEHGTTGLKQNCMPSLVTNPALGIPALSQALAAGWVIVATDYSFVEKDGPHPYLIGAGEARAALDSVRAARQMKDLALDKRTVVWGHSQGGHAALWTGIVGPAYAPDIDIVGIAAIAPPGDMAYLLSLNEPLDKRLGPYLAMAYSRFYSDITFRKAIRPSARKASRAIVDLCGFLPPEEPVQIVKLASSYKGRALATNSNPALAARLKENTADRPITAPLLITQGLSDVVVLPTATDTFVQQRCKAGQQLEYWTFAGRDHGGIVQPGSALEKPLMNWTLARFKGEPAPAGCTRHSF